MGGQGDAPAPQPRPESLPQQLLLQAQTQGPQASQQEVQPEMHEDTGIPIPAGREKPVDGGLRWNLLECPGASGVPPPEAALTHQ